MLTFPSYAKVNWFLRILRRRGDGFHELETLFQTIDLHDEIDFVRADRDTLVCDDPTIPTGASNLVMRAVALLRESRSVPPVGIRIRKRIPAGGGLGGGSSNAAVTLRAINSLFDLGIRSDELHRIAGQLGSDVPFFLVGGTAYATGRGEVLTPMDPVEPIPMLLILPKERVPTPEAYRAFARMREERGIGGEIPRGIESIRSGIKGGSRALALQMANDLEEPVFAMIPELRRWKQRLLDEGAAAALMSGSGSTMFGIFDDGASRDRARASLAEEVSVVAALPTRG